MISFTNTIDIDRTADEVYTYLARLEHLPEWNWAIASSTKITPGPVTVGSRFRLSRATPARATDVLEVTELRPGRRLSIAGRLGPFAARLTYDLADTDNGTRLTNHVELEPPLPLGPLSQVVGGRIGSEVAANLGVLKGVLQGQSVRGRELVG